MVVPYDNIDVSDAALTELEELVESTVAYHRQKQVAHFRTIAHHSMQRYVSEGLDRELKFADRSQRVVDTQLKLWMEQYMAVPVARLFKMMPYRVGFQHITAGMVAYVSINLQRPEPYTLLFRESFYDVSGYERAER